MIMNSAFLIVSSVAFFVSGTLVDFFDDLNELFFLPDSVVGFQVYDWEVVSSDYLDFAFVFRLVFLDLFLGRVFVYSFFERLISSAESICSVEQFLV